MNIILEDDIPVSQRATCLAFPEKIEVQKANRCLA